MLGCIDIGVSVTEGWREELSGVPQSPPWSIPVTPAAAVSPLSYTVCRAGAPVTLTAAVG